MTDKITTRIEKIIERGLFASRWLLAPFYIGLVFALIILLFNFIRELWHFFTRIAHITNNDTILGILSLIDLSLAGNLLLIVIFSGYENFVSKMDIDDHKDHPEWHGTIDFWTLKLKLIASIVAISGIHLLEVFMNIEKIPESKIMWTIIIYLLFVVSGVLLALMDKIMASTKVMKK